MTVPYLLPWSSVATFWLKKGVLASLYSEKCMKMQYFHQEGGGGVHRVRPMLDPPLGRRPILELR